MISRDKVPAVKLPEEEVRVEALDDTVLVRGLGFAPAMAFAIDFKAGEHGQVSRLLAGTVLAGDGDPLYDAASWEAFGNAHPEDMVELYRVARRLSGLDAEDAEKK